MTSAIASIFISKRAHFTRLLIWLFVMTGATAVITAITTSMPITQIRRADFFLYYFGAVVEHHGTYTDTSQIIAQAHNFGVNVPPQGIYGTPMLVALVFMPLTLLGPVAASQLWWILCVAATVIAVRKAVSSRSYMNGLPVRFHSSMSGARQHIGWWILWVVLLMFCTSTMGALRLGNAAVLTSALIIYTYGAIKNGEERRAGIALGIAIGIKLYPAFLLIALISCRRKQSTIWALATASAMTVATLLVLGPHDMILATQVQASVAGRVDPWIYNISVPAHIVRWTHNNAFAASISKIFVVIAAWLVWRSRSVKHPEFALAIASIVMLLVQTISWQFYAEALIVGVIYTFEYCKSRLWKGTALLAFLTTNGIISYAIGSYSWINPWILQTVGVLALLVVVWSVPKINSSQDELVKKESEKAINSDVEMTM